MFLKHILTDMGWIVVLVFLEKGCHVHHDAWCDLGTGWYITRLGLGASWMAGFVAARGWCMTGVRIEGWG